MAEPFGVGSDGPPPRFSPGSRVIDQHDRDHHTRWRAEHPPRPAPAVVASVTAFQTLKGHVDTETTRLGANLAARVNVVEEGAALLDERVDDVVATVDENLEKASQRFAWVGKTVKDGLAENSGRVTALESAWEAFKRVG